MWGLWILLALAVVGTGLPCLLFGYAAFKSRHGQGGESVLVFPGGAVLLFALPVWVLIGLLSGLGLAAWGHGAAGATGVGALVVFGLFTVAAGGYALVAYVRGTRRAARLNKQQVPYPD